MSLLHSTQQIADLPAISGFLILSAQRISDARSHADLPNRITLGQAHQGGFHE